MSKSKKGPPHPISIVSFPSITELIDKLNRSKKQNYVNETEKQTILRNYISPLAYLQKSLNEKKYKIDSQQSKLSAKTSRDSKRLINNQHKAKSFIIPEINAKEKHNTLIKSRNPSKASNLLQCPSIGRYTLNCPNSNSVNQSSVHIKNLHLESVRENLSIHLAIAQSNKAIDTLIQKGMNSSQDIGNMHNAINAYFADIDKLYDISYNFKCFEVKKSNKLSALFTIEKINTSYTNLMKIQVILYTIVHLAIKHLPQEDVISLFVLNINSIIKKISHTLNLIYGNYMIIGKEIKPHKDSVHLRLPFIDNLVSYYKRYKARSSKDNCLLLTVIKGTDASFKELKEYVNHTMKYSKLKQFSFMTNSMLDMYESKTEKYIAKVTICCVVYFEYQKRNKWSHTLSTPKHLNIQHESIPSIASEDSLLANYLPPINNSFSYSLVVDLDETLVHYIQSNSDGTYFIRPFCFDFLEELYNQYELIVFTAGTKEYADIILNKIDYDQKYFKHRLYRDHITVSQYSIFKDLSKLGRDLSKIIIIDNLEENFTKQPHNGLHIKSWNGDLNDSQLLDLIPILKDISYYQPKDIREVVKYINRETKAKSVASPYSSINMKDYFV